ncbi:MAG TPA: ester cyclase [Candidatus Bathyarchaeia archaeon]|nr:ester cyclase [Candidatus Bathyarchaeia archaeon]
MNKSVAGAFFEQVLSQGQLEHYPDSHAGNFVAHGAERDYSLAEDMAAAKEERTAMPDMRVKVNEVVAERDLVSVFWTATGTNTHEGMGFPASGKRITVNGMTLFRFRDGKIVEEWSVFDMLSAMRQAGVLPAK